MSEVIIFSTKGKLVCKPFEVNSIDSVSEEDLPIEKIADE